MAKTSSWRTRLGYDMHSTRFDDAQGGYFRLDIWGMGFMRDAMWTAGIRGDKIYEKFSSNDGWLVGKRMGKKICDALLKLIDGNVNTITKSGFCFKKEDIPAGATILRESTFDATGGRKMTSYDYETTGPMTEEERAVIKEFAEYNRDKTPYKVW